MSTFATIISVIAIGCGATLVMDVWLALLRRVGVKTASFGLIGRWVAHVFRGRFTHTSIARAEPVIGEEALGWVVHYATGIVFSAALIAVTGVGWIQAPTPAPAMLFGLVSVGAPLLVMQPAMGSGFFASKTPSPIANSVRSVVNHLVFGAGLYIAAIARAGFI